MSPSEQLLREMRQEFPAFRVVHKSQSGLSRWIHWALIALTLGRQRDYLRSYHTVLGYTLYLPDTWSVTAEVDRVIVLRHERIHLRQRRRLGALLMAGIYLLPFFPVGLAYGRARLEWEAYRETLRATAELLGLPAARSEVLRQRIIGRFIGGAYGWMWPFPAWVGRWYESELDDLERRFGPEGPRPASQDPGTGAKRRAKDMESTSE